MNKYIQVLNKNGEFLGHGIDDNGRVYEGYLIGGECKYFNVDDGTERPDCE